MDIVAPPGHPLAGKTGIEMAALKQYGWVLGSENDPQRKYLKGVFASKDMVPPKVTIECRTREVAIRTVQRSDLLTLVSNIRTHPKYATLERVDCPALRWVRIAGIVSREDFTPLAGGIALIEHIKRLCLCTIQAHA